MNLDFDFKSLLETPDRSTLIGKRDFAILNLICHDRLKNGQIARINLSDFDFEQRSLQISTKSNDKINLHPKTAVALQDWLENIDHDPDSPLFFALDRSSYGHRLTGTAIYKIIAKVAKSANIEHPISPERLRAKLIQDIPKSTIPILATEIIPSRSRSISEFDLHRAQHSILDDLLADKRSVNTKRAYERDLQYFFQFAYSQAPAESLIQQFLQLNRFEAIALVLKYKSAAIAQGLKEATVNRRIASIKALVNFAGKIGHCTWTLNEVQSESIQTYRDTTGVGLDGISSMMRQIDRDSLSGIRNYAIFRLLWDNALRRNEVSMTDLGDFDSTGRSIQIIGKGRGTQKSPISLSQATTTAIQTWISARKKITPNIELNSPLFIALDRAKWGHRLTGTSIYKIVDSIAKAAGISKQMSPHRIRHSAITAALDATDGNVRKVQKLSRHKKIDTLILYDDNRKNMQGEVTDLLSELI